MQQLRLTLIHRIGKYFAACRACGAHGELGATFSSGQILHDAGWHLLAARDAAGREQEYLLCSDCAKALQYRWDNRHCSGELYREEKDFFHSVICNEDDELRRQKEFERREREEPDTRGPAIYVRGSLIGGFEAIGPFPTVQDCLDWCNNDTLAGAISKLSEKDAADNGGTIMILQPPTKECRTG